MCRSICCPKSRQEVCGTEAFSERGAGLGARGGRQLLPKLTRHNNNNNNNNVIGLRAMGLAMRAAGRTCYNSS